MVNLNDAPRFTVTSGRIELADCADRTVNPQTEQAISRISLSPPDNRQFDGAFHQRLLIRRMNLLDRVIAVEFGHRRKYRDNQLTARLSYRIILETTINATIVKLPLSMIQSAKD